MGKGVSRISLIALTALLLAAPNQALAYIGPGAGLGAIGTVIGIIGAALLLVVGFLWYPIKRMMKKRKAGQESSTQAKDE